MQEKSMEGPSMYLDTKDADYVYVYNEHIFCLYETNRRVYRNILKRKIQLLGFTATSEF